MHCPVLTCTIMFIINAAPTETETKQTSELCKMRQHKAGLDYCSINTLDSEN